MTERPPPRDADVPGVEMALGSAEAVVNRRLSSWTESRAASRFWKKDATFWPEAPAKDVSTRLGWLHPPGSPAASPEELNAFATEVRREGFRNAVVLGMGGSSLAPDVFSRTFARASAAPELLVLDSTHPDAVSALARRVDLPKTLFLVSSKSGTTIEPLSFFRFFWQELARLTDAPARQFVAITDPGTALETLAREHGFRRTFPGDPEVGGRYSALTAFGLVPAALMGVNVRELLARAKRMADACGPEVHPRENPGFCLGAALGELARAGRDKVTFFADPPYDAFPTWAEQLLAESTGKHGRGLIPVVGEAPASPDRYAADRVFVLLEALQGGTVGQLAGPLASRGHPVIRIRLADPLDLGYEFFRWEVAVAVAGPILGIDPFDQPDVELAKQLAREAMAGTGASAPVPPEREADVTDGKEVSGLLARWTAGLGPSEYLGIHAYLAPTVPTTTALEELRSALFARWHRATTLGYGPRFLHSTGQLHKGGPATGRFLQLLYESPRDVPVPETDFTFGRLIQSQALGDFQALRQRGREVVRVHLGANPVEGVQAVTRSIRG